MPGLEIGFGGSVLRFWEPPIANLQAWRFEKRAWGLILNLPNFDFESRWLRFPQACVSKSRCYRRPLGKKHFLTEMRGLGFGFGSKAIGRAKDKASTKAKSKAALGSILDPPSFDFGSKWLQFCKFCNFLNRCSRLPLGKKHFLTKMRGLELGFGGSTYKNP